MHWYFDQEGRKCDQELNISIQVKIHGCLITKLIYGSICWTNGIQWVYIVMQSYVWFKMARWLRVSKNLATRY
jgi:hypothetical protein